VRNSQQARQGGQSSCSIRSWKVLAASRQAELCRRQGCEAVSRQCSLVFRLVGEAKAASNDVAHQGQLLFRLLAAGNVWQDWDVASLAPTALSPPPTTVGTSAATPPLPEAATAAGQGRGGNTVLLRFSGSRGPLMPSAVWGSTGSRQLWRRQRTRLRVVRQGPQRRRNLSLQAASDIALFQQGLAASCRR
jgi:hypothetical protein